MTTMWPAATPREVSQSRTCVVRPLPVVEDDDSGRLACTPVSELRRWRLEHLLAKLSALTGGPAAISQPSERKLGGGVLARRGSAVSAVLFKHLAVGSRDVLWRGPHGTVAYGVAVLASAVRLMRANPCCGLRLELRRAGARRSGCRARQWNNMASGTGRPRWKKKKNIINILPASPPPPLPPILMSTVPCIPVDEGRHRLGKSRVGGFPDFARLTWLRRHLSGEALSRYRPRRANCISAIGPPRSNPVR